LLDQILLEFSVKCFKLRNTSQITFNYCINVCFVHDILIVRPNLIRIPCQDFQVT